MNMIMRFIANLSIFLALASFCFSESMFFSLLNLSLDDPMVADIYNFIDRITLKYQLTGLLKNRRPYTYDEIYNTLNRLAKEDYELTLIERQQLESFTNYFSQLDSLLTKKGKDYQFNLNLELGLISTYRSLPANPSGTEYTWQIRPIVTGRVQENFAFLTDLRFFLITNRALGDTVRTEVKVDQLNETAFDTAGLASSYLKFKLPWFDLLAGKQNLSWGPGRHGNLLLSAHAMPMEMIQIIGDYGKVGFQAFQAIGQSGFGNKILSGHRLDLHPIDQLRLGISEIVVNGADNFDLRFLNPITIYTISEPSGGGHYASGVEISKGNLLINGDAMLKLWHNLVAYGEVMIDDFQPRYNLKSYLHWGSKWGILCGVQIVDPLTMPNTDFRFEYAFVNQYTYTHIIPVNTYTHLERSIGHHIGPDAQSVWAQLQHRWTSTFSTELNLEIQHQGEQDINQPRDRSRPVDEHWHYLSGAEEIRRSFGLAGCFEQFGQFLIEGRYGLVTIQNLNHQLETQDLQQEFRLTFLYRF